MQSIKMSRPISRVLSWTIIHLGNMSPYASSDLPENNAGRTICSPIRSCSKWGLPSRKLLPVARCALTAPFHPYRPRINWAGGLLSAALSVGSRPPGVTWHSTLWSPDFPPPGDIINDYVTRPRLPGRLSAYYTLQKHFSLAAFPTPADKSCSFFDP